MIRESNFFGISFSCKKNYRLKCGHINPKDCQELLSWLKSESDRILWSGNTFKKGLTLQKFLIHQKRKDLCAFSLRDEVLDICAYAEVVKKTRLQFNLCRVIVKPCLRRKGLGKSFCKEIIDFSQKRLGCTRLILNTLENNTSALCCYRSLGFEILEVKRKSRILNNQWIDLIILCKNITPQKKNLSLS